MCIRDRGVFGRVGVVKNHLLVCSNFNALDIILKNKGIDKVDAILADLGWRLEQFESSGKGFSFRLEEPLIMTYGQSEDYPFTAYEIVNDWAESNLADILYYYGEERHSRRIAAAICEARKKEPIKTGKQLADICLLYTSPSPRDRTRSRMPSSA